MLLADLIALPICFLIAMILRLGSVDATLRLGIASYLLLAFITIAAFSLSDLYRAVIRYIDQYLLVATGIGLAMALTCVYVISLSQSDDNFPRSALLIYWFIAFSYVVISRLSIRLLLRRHISQQQPGAQQVAIYGAGDTGARLANAMRHGDDYRPMCFFDEKHVLDKRSIGGLRVFHSDRMGELAAKLELSALVIATPGASPERLRRIMHMGGEAGLPVKILNKLVDLSDGKMPRLAIREIKLEDLLGRSPVPPRTELFAKCVQGKAVLVTGAGGSIGSELCRQIITLAPRCLHLLDHSEFALYTIRQELLTRCPTLDIHAHLGSVCSIALLERILQASAIDTIYHAAAYKHVPLVEANIVEGLRNNVLGAQVVALTAARHQVQTCVLISSDKAVRPTNIMGASKRIAELIFQAGARLAPRTTFCMVRFGNVLGSSGSVVPLFQRQIEAGGPMTITHPDVSRYFMLIPEAAQLVIQAGAMATGGDVFVLDMGEPIKIVDLARTMIMLSGLSEKTPQHPHGDIAIEYVGLFPGEKLHEELLIADCATPSTHPRILCMKEGAIDPAELDHYIQLLITACNTNDRWMIESMVKTIVNEFTPQSAAEPDLALNAVAPRSQRSLGPGVLQARA